MGASLFYELEEWDAEIGVAGGHAVPFSYQAQVISSDGRGPSAMFRVGVALFENELTRQIIEHLLNVIEWDASHVRNLILYHFVGLGVGLRDGGLRNDSFLGRHLMSLAKMKKPPVHDAGGF
jgi:hypothetical protein